MTLNPVHPRENLFQFALLDETEVLSNKQHTSVSFVS